MDTSGIKSGHYQRNQGEQKAHAQEHFVPSFGAFTRFCALLGDIGSMTQDELRARIHDRTDRPISPSLPIIETARTDEKYRQKNYSERQASKQSFHGLVSLSGVCVVAEIGDSGIGVNAGRPRRIHHCWTSSAGLGRERRDRSDGHSLVPSGVEGLTLAATGGTRLGRGRGGQPGSWSRS